jgi:predicted nuclease with RNAse H fold
MTWLGIDYGSKLAGTTAVAFLQNDNLIIVQSRKKQDADALITDLVESLNPDSIFIDVPLSLPAAYLNPSKHSDYFFRDCDKTLSAMSPMFLGGLTARGMKLKGEMAAKGILLYETYPSALARTLDITDWQMVHQEITSVFIDTRIQTPITKHQADALLCFLTGFRFQNHTAQIVGNASEGLIYI